MTDEGESCADPIYLRLILLAAGAVIGAVIEEPIKNWWSAAKISATIESVQATNPSPDDDILIASDDNWSSLRNSLLRNKWKSIIANRNLTRGECLAERSHLDDLRARLAQLVDKLPKQDASDDEFSQFYRRNREAFRDALDRLTESTNSEAAQETADYHHIDPRPQRPFFSLTPVPTERPLPELPDIKTLVGLLRKYHDQFKKQLDDAVSILDEVSKSKIDTSPPRYSVSMSMLNAGHSPTSIQPVAALFVQEKPSEFAGPLFMRISGSDEKSNGSDNPLRLPAGEAALVTFQADTKTVPICAH